jgi:cob(I)alamin adenosyltransferase
MGLPKEPITLAVEEITELNRKLSHLRHDINNNLSLIVAAVELIRHKPQTAERMLVTLSEQPPKMTACLNRFSAEFERALGITGP